MNLSPLYDINDTVYVIKFKDLFFTPYAIDIVTIEAKIDKERRKDIIYNGSYHEPGPCYNPLITVYGTINEANEVARKLNTETYK